MKAAGGSGCRLPPVHSAFLPFSKGSVTASLWVSRTWTVEVMLQRRMAPACRCPPLVTPTCWWCPVLCQRPPGRAQPGQPLAPRAMQSVQLLREQGVPKACLMFIIVNDMFKSH